MILMRPHPALCAAGLAAAAAVLVAGPAGAVEKPRETGCPAAFDVRTVASLAETGNEPVPGIVDAAGNANGLVCAKPLSDAAAEVFCRQFDGCVPDIIYYYLDDSIAQHG
jgi:hypothetical protein